MPRIHPASSARSATLQDAWGSLTWLANAQAIGSKGLAMARVTIKAGQSNPRHAHPTCEELLYLLKGSLRHTVGDEAVTLNAGDTLLIPPGVFHNATALGTEDADMIVTYSSGTRDFVLEDPNAAKAGGAER